MSVASLSSANPGVRPVPVTNDNVGISDSSKVKPQNPKAGLSPAMAFWGKKLFTSKKSEFASATLSTPGKIIGSLLTLTAGGLALKTLYDYVMDVTDSAWNKIAYLSAAATSGVLALGSFITSNVSENYTVISPEERVKDSQFKQELFKNVVTSFVQTLTMPSGITKDIPGTRFSTVGHFFTCVAMSDRDNVTEIPYYSLKLKYPDPNESKFYLEPLNDSFFYYNDNKSRHKYTVRAEFDLIDLELINPIGSAPFKIYILGKEFNSNAEYKQIGGPYYPITIDEVTGWLNIKLPVSIDDIDLD